MDDDTRLVIERCPHGGYLVTEFMGSKPLCSGNIGKVLRFIKDRIEKKIEDDPKHGDNMPL